MKVGLVRPGGLHRDDLPLVELDPREDEHRSDQRAADSAQGIERLREVQAPFRSGRIAQLRDERVRARFQKAQPRRDHEQRHQEEAVLAHNRSRPEQQGSRAVEQQPDHQAELVTAPAHDQSRRHRHREVPQVKSRLKQPRLGAGDLKRLHELADQNVVQVVGNRPQEEQRRDQHEREQVLPRNQLVTGLHAAIPGARASCRKYSPGAPGPGTWPLSPPARGWPPLRPARRQPGCGSICAGPSTGPALRRK